MAELLRGRDRLRLTRALSSLAAIDNVLAPETVQAETGFNVRRDFGAAGDGSADDTAKIEAARLACAAAGGGSILLPAGIYRIATTIAPDTGVTFQGAGVDSTTLLFDDTPGNSFVGGGGGFTTETALTADTTIGSDTITVASASGLAVDDLVQLLDDYGNGTTQEQNPQLSTRIRGIAGTTLTLEEPLPAVILAASNGRLRKYANPLRNFAVRDMTLKVAGSGASRDTLLYFTHAWNCSVERVRFANLNKTDATALAVGQGLAVSARFCVFEDCNHAFSGIHMSHSELVDSKIRSSEPSGAKFNRSSFCALDRNDVVAAHDSAGTGRGLKHEFGCVHSTINGNRVVGAGQTGIYAAGCSHIQINNNKVFRPYNAQSYGSIGIGVTVGTGTDWDSIHHISIVGNTIDHAVGTASYSGNGIYVDSLTRGQISVVGNHISCAAPAANTYGIRADGPRLTIVGNTIEGWGAGGQVAGIYLHTAAEKCLVTGNLLFNGGAATGKAIDTSYSLGSNKVGGNMTLNETVVYHATDVTEPADMIDFETEYGAVRSFTTGDETANETAFANLCADLRAYTTRGGIRKIWFGPSNGKAYWINSNVELEDLEDVVFVFDSGPEFSGTVVYYSEVGVYFMWSGAEDVAMFSVIASGGTIQRGLHWQGSWTFATDTDGYGYAIFIDGVNNWGGPSSVVSLTTQGNTKFLKRGVMCDNAINGDNAHGLIGAVYSGGCEQGALYAQGGGFAVLAGNISTAAGQTGVYIGPDGSEMKLGKALKIDGGATVLVDCQGSFCDFEGQFEGFSGGTALIIDRTVNSGNCGRGNRIGGNFIGSDGTGRAWIVRNTGGGGMYGNKLDMPMYSNDLGQSKAADATVLPDGEGVFDCGMDYYRLIVSGAYV